MFSKFQPLATLSSLLVLSLSGVALGQNTEEVVEEVLITGEIRSTRPLELANSVSVIDETVIKARNAKNLEDLLNIAPNVNYSTGASRGRYIQIRGIGERSQFVAPINPSVGVIVDGIDFTGLATGVTALDTAQVEVFRGPQGTLYGANALAGMINVVGNRPEETTAGAIAAGAGSHGTFDVSGMFTTPLSENAGWRVAVQKNVSNGYIQNDFLNRDDTNNLDELSLRNHLSFQVLETLSVDLTSYYIDVDNGYDAFSLDNNRTTFSDEPGHDRQTTVAHALSAGYEGLSFADVNAVVSYASSDVEYGYDEDWANLNLCTDFPTCIYGSYSSADNYERDNSNRSVDVRFVSKATQGPLKWAVGVYDRNQQVDLLRTYFGDYSSRYTTDSTAIYGQVDYQLSDVLTLIGGLRNEVFDANFNDSEAVAFKPSDNFWGGKLALEAKVAESTLVYGLVSRGYKAGGFNADPLLDDDLRLFEPESMVNYEVGVKGNWLDNTLTAQLAGFYQERTDIQAKQSRAYPIEGEAYVDFVEYLSNAEAGSNAGLEAEVNWRANESLTIFSTVGLLNTNYDGFENRSHVDRNEETGDGYDMSQRDQAHAPNYQYFVAAQYDFSLPINVRVELEGKDSFYFSESHNEKSEPYNLLNIRLTYDRDAVSVSLWGKNLTDETIETRGFYFSHAGGNDPRKGYAPEPYTQKGAPLTYGVSASYRF
ncbi:TonB-dependent receptor [Teredinibacter purpureus]|uniref:TonB-dependent receptor n=1 Tax=Teredinibacter purpureus TaxID=2731756 RepID=UPI000696C802|nr:TonB-dependent receptor [Teredinibacter purpureus]